MCSVKGVGCSVQSEFLKAVIMQSHDCAKYNRNMRKFWTSERKTGKIGTSFMSLSQFDKVFSSSSFTCFMERFTYAFLRKNVYW